jgi:hypothetical protein
MQDSIHKKKPSPSSGNARLLPLSLTRPFGTSLGLSRREELLFGQWTRVEIQGVLAGRRHAVTLVLPSFIDENILKGSCRLAAFRFIVARTLKTAGLSERFPTAQCLVGVAECLVNHRLTLILPATLGILGLGTGRDR